MKPTHRGTQTERLPRDLELYLDGLDATTDGRGWGLEHQEALERIVRILDAHQDFVRFARQVIQGREERSLLTRIAQTLIIESGG